MRPVRVARASARSPLPVVAAGHKCKALAFVHIKDQASPHQGAVSWLLQCLTFSVLHCLSLPGSVCGWFGFCNWSRKNIQILLPEAQSESHWIFPGWCVRGPYWLAFDRHDLRNLRILSLVQGLFPSGGWLYQKSACPWIPPESPWNQIIRRQGRRKQQYGITTRELKNLNTVLFIKPF